MAVFSTNLVIYTHTDFEQTFLLEDSQSNSAKDLTGFTGTCRFKRQIQQNTMKSQSFNLSFPNRLLGKVRISLTAAETALLQVTPHGKQFYELMLTDPDGNVERVIEGIVIVKQPVTWPSPPPENPFDEQVP